MPLSRHRVDGDLMTTYVYYDLKGIQSFIFAIPRLTFMIGGSAMIDEFDADFAVGLKGDGVHLVFAGGGKGCFRCASDKDGDRVEKALRDRARELGMAIELARSTEFHADGPERGHLYHGLPEGDELEGHPCAASGTWPVKDADLISEKVEERRERRARYEQTLLEKLEPKGWLKDQNTEFFRNVNVEGEARDTSVHSRKRALAGAAALGNTNRWAVIAMDGNDIGAQYAKAKAQHTAGEVEAWTSEMSERLRECCVHACVAGLNQVLDEWVAEVASKDEDDLSNQAFRVDGTVILPVRPLVLGGDDLIVLCHPGYAFDFVAAAAKAFNVKSREDRDLWLATGGELTVSAGVLFCGTSLPLASSVRYAEELMAEAKQRGRELQQRGSAAPATINWEVVTESVIDSPRARRTRALEFFDGDLGTTVRLTRKPYTIDQLAELSSIADRLSPEDRPLPRGVGHRLRRILDQSYWNRRLGVASLAKQQPALAKFLEEPFEPVSGTSRWSFDRRRSTDVLDIIELIEERHRVARRGARPGEE